MFILICGTVFEVIESSMNQAVFSGLLIHKNIKTRDVFKNNTPVSWFSDLQAYQLHVVKLQFVGR